MFYILITVWMFMVNLLMTYGEVDPMRYLGPATVTRFKKQDVSVALIAHLVICINLVDAQNIICKPIRCMVIDCRRNIIFVPYCSERNTLSDGV